ncbi:stemmadenine O-acetyltransferase-like [Corylus avellana]|uniref:stemmadenine O-acetyltransferase-like n=1 Tax=Corylus avellana TaxID=13451 RepID=UPI001E1EB978|nr:stemmadenine O-acetyltransferase-like [Corylus avellana]
MQVRIISRETIKPSSPTPSHLKTLKFSLFDQIAPKTYIPTILFYPTNDGLLRLSQISSHLKKSLSEALTRFYPLSGRKKDNFSMECDDQGASYSEALVDYNMSEFLDPPKIDLLNQLLPCQPWVTCQDRASTVFLAIHVNFFNCGGIAIGVCVLHTIADGITVSAFLKTWATIARGANDDDDDQLYSPDFTTASALFPPRDVLPLTPPNRFRLAWNKEAVSVTRRFVFDANSMAALKAKVKGEHVSNPTGYESLAALMWKCLIHVSRMTSGIPTQLSYLEHAVDMRRRMGKPLSACSMGNLVTTASAVHHAADTAMKKSCCLPNTTVIMRELASKVRQSIEEINGDLLTSLQGDEGFLLISGHGEMLAQVVKKVEPESVGFTSWRNFGFNEINFGWGKPVWVGISGGVNLSYVNYVLFKDVECGNNGTEAWVTLEEKKMAVFENDPDLLAFALPNPSVRCPPGSQ